VKGLGWLMSLFEHLRHAESAPPAPPAIDRAALRDEMTRSDPDFARVRDVHHDALQVITGGSAAKQLKDGMAIRREREFWEHHGSHGT
jgi:hypothetical protein